MSIYKYLDLDSTYRNRIIYPNPSNFVIPISLGTSNANSALNAQAPVADAYPFVISTTQAGSSTTQIVLNSSSSTISNFYNGKYLQIGTDYRIITAYNASTNTATVESPFTSAPGAGTTYYIRDGIPILSSTLAGGNNQVVQLGLSASSLDNSYVGYFIYFRSGAAIGQSSVIINYTGSTQTATLGKSLTAIPVAGDAYDILQFSYDSFQPLIYNGTLGFNQPVCYSIELLYVTLPIQLMTGGYGGTFNNYPYVYLELYNEGNIHSINNLYTNNPNAQIALFKIPLGGTCTGAFATYKDAKMIPVVKIKPDQALHFRLFLPDGSDIIFSTPDNQPPNAPNPFIQMSASFALRRIDGGIESK